MTGPAPFQHTLLRKFTLMKERYLTFYFLLKKESV